MPDRSSENPADDTSTTRVEHEVEEARLRVEQLQTDYEELLSDSDVIQEDRDAAALLLSAARSALETAEDAMVRVKAGSYGRCEVCDEEISQERLAAIPDAVRCVRCSA